MPTCFPKREITSELRYPLCSDRGRIHQDFINTVPLLTECNYESRLIARLHEHVADRPFFFLFFFFFLSNDFRTRPLIKADQRRTCTTGKVDTV